MRSRKTRRGSISFRMKRGSAEQEREPEINQKSGTLEYIRKAKARSPAHAKQLDMLNEYFVPDVSNLIASYANATVTKHDVGDIVDRKRQGWWTYNYQDGSKDKKLYIDGIEQKTDSYDPEGRLRKEIWYSNREIHRKDGPAIKKYNSKGILVREAWYLHGKIHRENGLPAEIEYYDNGKPSYIATSFAGRLQSYDDRPARVYFREDGSIKKEEWFEDGLLDRYGGPAEISYNIDGTVREKKYRTKEPV